MKKDWEIKKLGDICLIKGRIGFRGYTKSDLVKKGEGAITLSPSNIIDNKLNFSNCSYISWPKYEESPEIQLAVGDIVFCKTASIGKTALINELPEKATLNPQFIVLKNIKCETQFLYYYLTCPSFKEKISQITTGTAVPTLSQSNFSNLPIALPPLEEQKRIVKILDEKFVQLESLKANAQNNLQNAKDLFQSQLAKAFSNTTWEKKKVSEISENLDSKRIPITKNVRKTGQYPYYGASGIVDYVEDYIFDGKFLLVSEDGANLLARTYPIAFIAEGKFWVNNHAHILSFKDEITMKFVELFFSNLDISPYVTGMAQPKFNQASLNNIEIPLPPLPEQKRIVKELDTLSEKVRQLQEIYTKQIANCDELKQSYLQKAFEGEL